MVAALGLLYAGLAVGAEAHITTSCPVIELLVDGLVARCEEIAVEYVSAFPTDLLPTAAYHLFLAFPLSPCKIFTALSRAPPYKGVGIKQFLLFEPEVLLVEPLSLGRGGQHLLDLFVLESLGALVLDAVNPHDL
jgi:hypothetical protein